MSDIKVTFGILASVAAGVIVSAITVNLTGVVLVGAIAMAAVVVAGSLASVNSFASN